MKQLLSIPDELWAKIEPLLPAELPKPKGGRPRMPNRQAMTAIFFILRTGMQWKALPRDMGAASTVHDRFQYWRENGVFRRLWEAGLHTYDEIKGIEWTWQTVDGAMTKAPLGGKRNGPQPDGSREIGHEAESVDRWTRHSLGHGGGRRQPSRHEDAEEHAERPRRTAAAPQ